MKKGILFILIYGFALYIGFLNREPLFNWLNQGSLAQLPYMFFLSILFSVIPVIPFSVFAGLMGAKYGVWVGAAINWVGSVGASAIFFLLARYFLEEKFQGYITKYKGIKKFDHIISQNAFIAVIFSRMIPVVPPPVVNIYSGLSKMLFRTYFFATAIGKVPGMFVYAYVGNQLFETNHRLISGIIIYVGFLLVVLLLYRLWYRGRSKVVMD
ncbi:TVP38/TMEM64 family protein [Mesobacillus foraminis]|uniref:TVP38/TMEM64 family protein n=1 Tax=Mesobacillus foraminis TaxID=279826 RepID=UPI000EF4F73C|nr:TVP38/TMEM64 family protein [Mesobacillus foraminis]